MVKRSLYKCFYGSSYDRGAEHALEIWPQIRKAVPEATFEIAYGWQLFENFYRGNPERQAWMRKINKLMEQPGITHHGRLSQPDVEKLMKQCGVFFYPTHFGEINCINALKSQAWGLIPVTIDYAALETTVQFGVKIRGDIWDPDVKKTYTKQLIWVLKNPEWQERVRKPMMKWASRVFSWHNVAQQWDAILRGKKTKPFLQIPKKGVLKIIDGITGKETQK